MEGLEEGLELMAIEVGMAIGVGCIEVWGVSSRQKLFGVGIEDEVCGPWVRK